jgi:hypothetical protein
MLPGGGYVVVGSFRDSITLGASMYTSSIDAPFVAGFASDGTLRWSRALPASPLGLGTDDAGYIYLALSGSGAIDLGGGALPAPAATALALASYEGTTGAHRWSRYETNDASGRVYPYGALLAVRASGPCFVADAADVIDLGGHAVIADGADSGPLVACFDDTGAYVSHVALPLRNVVAAHADGDELLLSGNTYDPGVDMGTGLVPEGGFLARHASDLTVRWVWASATSEFDHIAVGPTGRICAAGFGELVELEE